MPQRTKSGNSGLSRGYGLAQNNPEFAYLYGMNVKPKEVVPTMLDFSFGEMAKEYPVSALRLFHQQLIKFRSENATKIFVPHPGQQAVLDFLPSSRIIWLRPGQGFGKSVFNCWLVAKALKREPIILSNGSLWLPPKGKILIATKSRRAQADNLDGYIKAFMPERLIHKPRIHSQSPYKITDGAIEGAQFTTGMELITRTYDSNIEAFMNLTLSMCILDELPRDDRLLVEVVTRIARTGGILLISASDIYEETALSAERLKQSAKVGLVKIIEGASDENPHFAKSGLDLLDKFYTSEERKIRREGLGNHTPLKMFPNYDADIHRIDPRLPLPYGLSLDNAHFIAGLDQGSPATLWAYVLMAYWTGDQFPIGCELHETSNAVSIVLDDLHQVGTTDEILTLIDIINKPFQKIPGFPQGNELLVIGDPALKIIAPTDARSSYEVICEKYNLTTPDKPELLNSYNFMNDLFRKNLSFLSTKASNTHKNLMFLAKKGRVNSKNLPGLNLGSKDPTDALRYATHYIHASPPSPLFPHKAKYLADASLLSQPKFTSRSSTSAHKPRRRF